MSYSDDDEVMSGAYDEDEFGDDLNPDDLDLEDEKGKDFGFEEEETESAY